MLIENKTLNKKTPITSIPSTSLMYWLSNPAGVKVDNYITYANLETQILRSNKAAEFNTLTVSGVASFESTLTVSGELIASSGIKTNNLQSNSSAGTTLKTSSGTTVAQWGGGGSTVFDVPDIIHADNGISFDSGTTVLSSTSGFEDFFDTENLTIASGAITITSKALHVRIVVDTEGGASSDTLDTINGTIAGQILTIQTASSSRDVTFSDGVGNIFSASSTLGDSTDAAMFISNGTNVYMTSYSNN